MARVKAWVALALPAAGWFGFQQGLAMTVSGACVRAGVPLGSIWGMVSLLVCAGAGWLALAVARGTTGSDRFVARLALLGAGLFGLAIAYQTLATTIIPPCAR